MKPWMSWTLFAIGCGTISYVSGDRWLTRIVTFAILTVPIILWTRRRIDDNA